MSVTVARGRAIAVLAIWYGDTTISCCRRSTYSHFGRHALVAAHDVTTAARDRAAAVRAARDVLAGDRGRGAGVAGGEDIAGCTSSPAIGAGLTMRDRLASDLRGGLLYFSGRFGMGTGFALQAIAWLAGVGDGRQFLRPETVRCSTVVCAGGEIIFVAADVLLRTGSVAIAHVAAAGYLRVGTGFGGGGGVGAGKRIGVAGKYEIGADAAEHDDKQYEQYAVEAQRDAA